MSRRYTRSRGRLTRGRYTIQSEQYAYEPAEPAEPYWYKEPMPEPWQAYLWREWQEAWVETTLSVCRAVWRKQGARIYAAQRDRLLRDDLQDWLVVEAQKIANNYTPDRAADDPERWYGAWLHRLLTMNARHHFGEVVGRSQADNPSGTAAVAAYQTGIGSTEHLDEIEDESGYVVDRHPLHGQDMFVGNPEDVMIRIETFDHEVDLIVREQRTSGIYTVPAGALCTELRCERPARTRGLCSSHYQRQLRLFEERGCAVPGCERPLFSRGVCQPHYDQHRRGTMEPDLRQFVQPPTQRGGGRAS